MNQSAQQSSEGPGIEAGGIARSAPIFGKVDKSGEGPSKSGGIAI